MSSTINALTSGGGIAITGDTSGSLALQTNNGTTAVTVDASQNVGIGTTSPTFPLDVRNSNLNVAKFQQTGSFQPVYMTSTTNLSGVMSETGNQNGLLMNSASNFTSLWASGAERMRIDSSGNLLVGTTAPPSSSGIGIGFQPGYSASGVSMVCRTNTTSANDHIYFYTPSGLAGYIRTTSATTSYVTTSDYRLKENVVPMTGALAKVAQLKPVTYTWKADGSASQGFIAHELQAVVPDCVTGEKDAVDSDGNPVYQGIDTSFLVATLTAAIQELKAELDATKAEVAALKGTA